jgi:hypothetical protein
MSQLAERGTWPVHSPVHAAGYTHVENTDERCVRCH